MALLPCSKYFVKIVEQSTAMVMMEPSSDSNNMTKPAPGKHLLDGGKTTSPLNAALDARKAVEAQGKSYTYLSRHNINPDSMALG